MSAVTSTTPFSVTWKRFSSSGEVRADAHAVGNLAALIDDGALDGAATADIHVRQDDRAVDEGALIDAHVGEDQGIRTCEPEMITPPDTMELTAMPRRASSSRMNFAGG